MGLQFGFSASDNLTDLVTDVNAVLASLLSHKIHASQFTSSLSARTSGSEYQVLISYEIGGQGITSPYKYTFFIGRNPTEAKNALADFIAANPTFWFGIPENHPIVDDRRVSRFIIGLIYNESAADGQANWQPLGSGGSSAVTSVFGRTGAVTAQTGDYNVGQITGAAASGANSDITSLSGLLTPLSVGQGGTGATNAADARANLGAIGGSPVAGQVAYGNGTGTVAFDATFTFDAVNKIVGARYFKFDTAATPPTHAEGMIYWDQTDKTLAIVPDINGPVLQVGQESWVRITNMTGSSLLNGTVVYINGAQGQRPTAAKARADQDSTSKAVLGMVTFDIASAPNSEGFVTTEGLVRGLDTTASGIANGETWAVGDRLFLSATTAGVLTKTMPIAPNNTVVIGVVLQVHPTHGTIFVSPNVGWHINEISDIYVNDPQNGDVLTYSTGNGRWQNAQPVGPVPLSKTLTYNLDGTLNTISDSAGTKTMVYTDGKLTGIVGTGAYPDKTFTYSGDALVAVTVT